MHRCALLPNSPLALLTSPNSVVKLFSSFPFLSSTSSFPPSTSTRLGLMANSLGLSSYLSIFHFYFRSVSLVPRQPRHSQQRQHHPLQSQFSPCRFIPLLQRMRASAVPPCPDRQRINAQRQRNIRIRRRSLNPRLVPQIIVR